MISGRFMKFETRLKYSALGNVGGSCCFKRAERHFRGRSPKTFRRNGFEIRNFTFPPRLFFRAAQWPRASVAARGWQPPCDLAAGRKVLFLAVKTANSTLGCCLSQVKSSCYSPNSAFLVVLHEVMLLIRYRFLVAKPTAVALGPKHRQSKQHTRTPLHSNAAPVRALRRGAAHWGGRATAREGPRPPRAWNSG